MNTLSVVQWGTCRSRVCEIHTPWWMILGDFCSLLKTETQLANSKLALFDADVKLRLEDQTEMANCTLTCRAVHYENRCFVVVTWQYCNRLEKKINFDEPHVVSRA